MSGWRRVVPVAVQGASRRTASNGSSGSHSFASATHGFDHLGLGPEVPLERIRERFLRLVDRADVRRTMQRRMLDNDLRSGTERVARLIRRTLEKHDPR